VYPACSRPRPRLTAFPGISEYLQRPLYMIGASELGTDPRTLEVQLSRILDVGKLALLDYLFRFIMLNYMYHYSPWMGGRPSLGRGRRLPRTPQCS